MYKLRKIKTAAVIIARFQTPFLHKGHCQLINEIKSIHHKIIVVLGVSPVKCSKRNPYDFYTRERLLKKNYPELFILPLADHPSDMDWSYNLDQLLLNSFPNEGFVLYGSRDSFIGCYKGQLDVKELPAFNDDSATAIRLEYSDKVMDSEDFRLGINYAYHNTYSKIYPTVDVAVFGEERTKILLGQKKYSAKWRLPGGFADITDMDFESAARRELFEECGGIEVSPMEYVGSMKIDDWRYRAEEDKIMTLLFATDLLYGNPKAADDLFKTEWFNVSELEVMMKQDKIAGEHHDLINLLVKRITGVDSKKVFTQKN